MKLDSAETSRDSKWWQSFSTIKLRIMIIIVVGIVLCNSLLIGMDLLRKNFEYSTTQTYHQKQKRSVSRFPNQSLPSTISNNTCFTPACLAIASKIINNMNRNVDPCDDFSEFACGGFKQNTEIPDDKFVVSPFMAILDKRNNQLREVLSTPITLDEPAHIKTVKKFYMSCMDERFIEEQGHGPLKSLLEELGGWPVLDDNNWEKCDFDWIELKNRLDKIQNSDNTFISVEFTIDYKNNTKQVLLLDQPVFGVAREFLLEGMNNNIVKSYYKYMVDIAVLLGAPRRKAEAELLESLEFERQLANISLPFSRRRNVMALYNPMSLRELSHRYPTVPWKTFFNKIFAFKVNISDDEIVIVHAPNFLSNFEMLMKKTSGRTQANYALWKLVATFIPHSSNDLRLKQLEYMKTLEGKAQGEVRWKQCITSVSSYFPLCIGSLYVKKYFKQETKSTATEIFSNIQNVLLNILEEVDWMDENTRLKSLVKASYMVGNIGYPDELLDNEQLNELHEGLELTDNNYFNNILTILLFYRDNVITAFRMPVDHSNWLYRGESADVNAYYSFHNNHIEVPAAILQENLFNHNHPKYLNYGGIGIMIAHEATHAFDDQGRLFDETGRLINWWDLSTREKFLRKIECIKNQYNNYTESITGLHVNGMNTLGENIADNGGIKIAYLAYNKWVSKNGQEQSLPGLNFTPQQLFWISAANVWCSKRRPENLQTMIIDDIHSPEQFRIIGPLSNIIEFAQDFNCPAQTRLNPPEKCTIW